MRRLALLTAVLVLGLAGSAEAKLKPWARPHHMTVFVDSVLLSGKAAIKAGMPDWRMHFRGRPALMVREADAELRRSGDRVSPVCVVGLGYNSLWERDGRHYAIWSARFDGELRRFRRLLRARGAKQIVWVTLRRPTKATTPPSGWFQLHDYAWYFGYVNARLARFDQRYGDVALADWAAVSKHPGLTYDAIHLNAAGGKLMAQTIEDEVRGLARGEIPS